MRKSYSAPRAALLATGAFCLTGSFPRLMGLLTTKPEYVEVMKWVDAFAVACLGLSILWAISVITHNARIRMNTEKGNK